MTNFHDAIQGAIDTARNAAGVQVSYRRREEVEGERLLLSGITALVGESKFEKLTASGTSIMTPVRDFLIDADELLTGDEPDAATFEPVPGDVISMLKGPTRYLFEVMPLEGTRESEWLNTTTNQYRIHTRLVKRQPAGDPWP